MITTRVKTMDRDVALLIDEVTSPRTYSQQFGRAARDIINDQDDVNDAALGRDVDYETFVDGRASDQLETAERVIVAEWELLVGVFQDTLKLLRESAPVLRGTYRDSITLFADMTPVATGALVPDAQEYFIAATVPYARKIERGLSNMAPNGVFQAVAAVAAKRYGNIARIRFGFRSLRGGAIGAWAARTRLQSRAPSRNLPGPRRQEWLTRQPAIILVAR